MTLPPTLLAADFGGIIFIVFLAISVISWIMNQVKAQKQPPPPRPQAGRPPQRRNVQIQREIDQFLKDAAGQQPRRGQVLAAEDIEIVQSPRRPPQARGKPTTPAPRQPRAPAPVPVPAPTHMRPGQGLEAHHLDTHTHIPTNVSLRDRLEKREAAAEIAHQQSAVDQSVAAHLGAFGAESATSDGSRSRDETRRRRSGPAAQLRARLRSKRGVRTAILMQEILQRPRALRRRASRR